jgi:hypothetical protein
MLRTIAGKPKSTFATMASNRRAIASSGAGIGFHPGIQRSAPVFHAPVFVKMHTIKGKKLQRFLAVACLV